MTATQKQKIKQMSDIKKIEDLLQGIVGEMCWGARLSFGNELRIEIGPKLSNSALKDKKKGLWRLGASASNWILELHSDKLITSNDDLIVINKNLKLIEGYPIAAFVIDWPKLGLEILFNNEMRLRILPIWSKDSDLAHWEFFMPNSMFLQVGPKSTWSYYRSDIPIP